MDQRKSHVQMELCLNNAPLGKYGDAEVEELNFYVLGVIGQSPVAIFNGWKRGSRETVDWQIPLKRLDRLTVTLRKTATVHGDSHPLKAIAPAHGSEEDWGHRLRFRLTMGKQTIFVSATEPLTLQVNATWRRGDDQLKLVAFTPDTGDEKGHLYWESKADHDEAFGIVIE